MIQTAVSKNRRDFLKKSLYSSPVVVTLGYLTPSMVYGDGSDILPSEQTVQIQSAGTGDAPSIAGAGQSSGSGNSDSGQTGTSTDGGVGSSPISGVEGAPTNTSDVNQTVGS